MLKKIALAMIHPELFTKKELKKLMQIKNLICEKMYQEYVKKRKRKLQASSFKLQASSAKRHEKDTIE